MQPLRLCEDNELMRILFFFSALFLIPALHAAENEAATSGSDSDGIIASLGEAVLTQREIDAMFSKIPEENRFAFIRDGAKVDQLIRALLKRKVVAADAVAAGYDKETLMAERMKLAAQKELADAWLVKKVEEAPAADFELLAHEDYIANPDSYRSEAVLDLSHILLGIEERSREDARIFAKHLDRQLRENPELFGEFVIQFSDDPSKSENDGRYPECTEAKWSGNLKKPLLHLKRMARSASLLKPNTDITSSA